MFLIVLSFVFLSAAAELEADIERQRLQHGNEADDPPSRALQEVDTPHAPQEVDTPHAAAVHVGDHSPLSSAQILSNAAPAAAEVRPGRDASLPPPPVPVDVAWDSDSTRDSVLESGDEELMAVDEDDDNGGAGVSSGQVRSDSVTNALLNC